LIIYLEPQISIAIEEYRKSFKVKYKANFKANKTNSLIKYEDSPIQVQVIGNESMKKSKSKIIARSYGIKTIVIKPFPKSNPDNYLNIKKNNSVKKDDEEKWLMEIYNKQLVVI
jgi:hypothetical protein